MGTFDAWPGAERKGCAPPAQNSGKSEAGVGIDLVPIVRVSGQHRMVSHAVLS